MEIELLPQEIQEDIRSKKDSAALKYTRSRSRDEVWHTVGFLPVAPKITKWMLSGPLVYQEEIWVCPEHELWTTSHLKFFVHGLKHLWRDKTQELKVNPK